MPSAAGQWAQETEREERVRERETGTLRHSIACQFDPDTDTLNHNFRRTQAKPKR